MDCYVCEGCQFTSHEYIRICPICRREKGMNLQLYGLTYRLLVNILGTITADQLQQLADVTGYGPVEHTQLFQEIKEGFSIRD